MARYVRLFFGVLRKVVQKLLPICILTACAVMVWPQLSALDFDHIVAQWSALSAWQWVLALIFTAISFGAIAQYDVIAHRQLGTGQDSSTARRCGMAAVALSQTTGVALLVATLCRWRMQPGFGPGVAAQITGYVSLLFLPALAGVTALSCLLLRGPPETLVVSWIVFGVVCGMIICAIVMPRIRWRSLYVSLPTMRAIFAASGWAFIDVLGAALAFYVLFPSQTAPHFAAFFPVFCLALSFGLFAGTPGGVGPFEMTLLTFTALNTPATTDTSALIATVISYRLVYFAIPAVIAAIALLMPRTAHVIWTDPPAPDIALAPRAETGIIHQNSGSIRRFGPSHYAIWNTGQAQVGLFDPFGPRIRPTLFSRLKIAADHNNRYACLYKCSARVASYARKAGWSVLHIADDAIVDLRTYSVDTPSRASLRRKLRKVARSDIQLRRFESRDTKQLHAIDTQWQSHNGRACGGTMGRFCPDYFGAQAVFVAVQGSTPIAFVSFHVSNTEWTLDVMRHGDNVPDGTMHALVAKGIAAAQNHGVRQVSLSGIVACADADNRFWRWYARQVLHVSRSGGLRQFKSTFAPNWRPLYAASPTVVSLTISLIDIAREVVWPSAISFKAHGQPNIRTSSWDNVGAAAAFDMNTRHNKDENYEVASSGAA